MKNVIPGDCSPGMAPRKRGTILVSFFASRLLWFIPIAGGNLIIIHKKKRAVKLTTRILLVLFVFVLYVDLNCSKEADMERGLEAICELVNVINKINTMGLGALALLVAFVAVCKK